jgi:hypothetical protein
VTVDQQTREQFFISALVTEHFVLQSARGAMIGEMVVVARSTWEAYRLR